MAINITTLFTRLGLIIGGCNESSTGVGGTANTRANNIEAQYQSAQQQVVDSLYAARDAYRQSASGWLSYLKSLADDTVIAMADEDGSGINPDTVDEALRKVITQGGFTINKPTVAATAAAVAGGVGDGVCVVSILDGKDGLQTDTAMAEDITLECTADGYLGGGATEGQEPFTFLGESPTADNMQWDWPNGSGCTGSISTTDADATGGLIEDGSFELWSGSPLAPDDWTVATGTAGTTVVRSSTAYKGSFALTFVGNGSELTTIRQSLTVSSLKPNTVYHFNCFLRTDGSVVAGTLRFRLVDNGNNVIADNAAVDNSATKTAASLTASYAAFNGSFRTPAQVPDVVKMEIGLSVALTNTEVLYIDDFMLVEATHLYGVPDGNGGPYATIFAGVIPFAIGDKFTITVTNSLGVTSFARSTDRLFDMKALGLKFPVSASPSQSDALIT